MEHKTEGAPQKRKSGRRTLLVFALLLAIAAGSVYAFLDFYGRYIDETLYAERLSQMREVTGQLFNSIDDVVDNQWFIAETQKGYLTEDRPATADELIGLMERQARLNAFTSSQSEMMAVDETGRYYTQNGVQGTLTGLDYLKDSPDRVSYVYNSMTSGKSEMVFLLRLEELLPIQVGSRTVRLTYYGVSRSMTELEPYFICEAYEGNNSVYVLDSNGAKLFSDSNNTLLRGYNLYDVLGKMEYLHGTSLADAKQELAEHNIAYSNAVLSGQEYYYSLYRMENAEWTLLFLVPSVCVATNTVAMINMTVRMILLFAVVLVTLFAGIIYVLLRIQQSQAIAVERRNSEALTEINRELDQKATELTYAVEAEKEAAEKAKQATAQAEKAMREAESASRAKSEFLSNMSHDIRTPMNAIVGITNLMEHEGNLSDRMRGYLQKIKFSSRHLLSLINDILDMSKIEANEVDLNLERVSLAEQVGQVDSIIRSQANENGQEFRIYVHEISHEYLIGDGVRLRQIFLNLLSNAVKYTPRGGKIAFDVAELPCGTPDHASFRFSVTDTGCGMTPEFVAHIFEPFTRAENSVTNKVQGTGLGMAITKNIVDLMGGTIAIQSEPGKGSRFDVELSMQIDHSASFDFAAEKILLLSDDETLSRNVRAAVRETDLKLTVVSTEQEADAYLAENRADVILLAGHLRDKTLAETIRVMRGLSENAMLIFCVDFAQRERVQETLAWMA